MQLEDLKYRASLAFMGTLVVVVVGYLVYKNYIKSQSEERYTVCEIVDKYVSAKDIGKRYEYYVEGKRFEGVCTSQECVDTEIGERFLIKFWIDKPEWTEIYFDRPVSQEVEVPSKGWKELPTL